MRTRKILVNGEIKEVVDWRGFLGNKTPDEVEPECKRIEIEPKKPEAPKKKKTHVIDDIRSSCSLCVYR